VSQKIVGSERRRGTILERRFVERGTTEWPLIEMCYLLLVCDGCTCVRTIGAEATHSRLGSCTLTVKGLWVYIDRSEDSE
jgi:hypothetical protein